MEQFFHMGGYEAYVWPSYGLAFIAFVSILIATRATLKKREAEFERLKRERQDG